MYNIMTEVYCSIF